MEFPFYKLDKDLVPLVYQYDDYTGTADQFELRHIDDTTSGIVFGWMFDKDKAQRVADLLNKQYEQQGWQSVCGVDYWES